MNDDYAIIVENLHKSFRLPHEQHNSLKQTVLNWHRRSYEEIEVLNGVGFKIKKGEFFGIVGKNGSGKSTLLKTIAGIYEPDRGGVLINGTLTPFIELGVGFNPELTGRDNVYLNGTIFGMTRKEVQNKYDEIVEFAEMERFMDQKLKNYSSGMQVRLAFSIAIQAQGDTLLLDEVLAVGDTSFQQKCFNYFEKLKHDNKTVVLVTHSMDSVKRFCDRALLMENGYLKLLGSPEDISSQYLLDNIDEPKRKKDTNRKSTKKLKSKVESLDVTLLSPKKISRNKNLRVRVSYILNDRIDPALGITISKNGISIAEINSTDKNLETSVGMAHTTECNVALNSFNPGQYKIDIAIFEKKNMELVGYMLDCEQFIIEGMDKTKGGAMRAEGGWSEVDTKASKKDKKQ